MSNLLKHLRKGTIRAFSLNINICDNLDHHNFCKLVSYKQIYTRFQNHFVYVISGNYFSQNMWKSQIFGVLNE